MTSITSTKAKRRAIAKAIASIAEQTDASVEIKEGPKAIDISVSKGPYRVMIGLDGRCDFLSAHWHMDHKSDARYPDGFAGAIGGSVNQYHFRKATKFAESVDEFIASLKAGLSALNAV